MPQTARRPLAVIAVLLLALSTTWVSGCNDFTSPSAQNPPPASQSSTTAPQGSISLVGEVLKPIKDTSTILVYDSTKSLSYLTGKSEYVRAAKGGTVSSGGFTVTIPPGALEKDTYITVRPSSLTQCQVELLPSGLQFRPGSVVTLGIDYNGTDGEGLTTLVCVWLDPTSNLWVRLPDGSNDLNARKYSVPLSHFSYYALAK